MSTKHKPAYPRVAQLKTEAEFLQRTQALGLDFPFSSEIDPHGFGETMEIAGMDKKPGNRFCILPMEGWDGTTDGRPTEFTKRRWKHFAISGAKLLFGCEAVAVSPEGRANPNQLMINEQNLSDFKDLLQMMKVEHSLAFGNTDDLLIGLQLTHSGRFCKPWSKTKMEPAILYTHPVLNKKFGLWDNYEVVTDSFIEELIQKYIKAAELAYEAGFDFVDIKHCHGYLGHEFLSSYDRPGKYGGSLENRSRFLKEIAQGIKKSVPGLGLAMRLSAIDMKPYVAGEEGRGVPAIVGPYNHAFGSHNGEDQDLSEPIEFLKIAQDLGINLICVTAGSPYYNPHLIRPALFPPSDGYTPPEDPLVGVLRHIKLTHQLKLALPEMSFIGSGYSYLQEWLPHVAQAVLEQGMADSIGFGRMVLSYPDMPADLLNGKPLQRKKICRTFSDCTTAPRNGLISGCFPLDSFYKESEYYDQLQTIK